MNKTIYRRYARICVKMGINLKKGQEVVLSISTSQSEFAKYIVEECYKAGAKKVTVEWNNDEIGRIGLEKQSLETLSEVADWQEEKAKHMAKVLPCKIHVVDSAPDAYAGLDMSKVSQARIARYNRLKKYSELVEGNDQWVIVAVPSEKWAVKVFPNEKPKTAVKKLWEAIIKTARIDTANPIKAWNEHIEYLNNKSTKMNDLKLSYLKYESANGTNLTIKLQPNHFWLSARETNKKGRDFCANMPTEEVFTMPMRQGVDGVVVATKPLSYQGQLINNFKCYFENGKCVKFEAEQGYEVLERMLNMDENSRYLGEVALVPFNSPINETGLLFYNTLFDENACCHLAFGQAFTNNIIGYEKMTEEDFKKQDVNKSVNHVDFMIGSSDLSIKGYDEAGKETVIFENGIWAI